MVICLLYLKLLYVYLLYVIIVMLDEIDGGRTLTKYYKVVYLRSIEYTHTNTTGIKKSLCLLRSYVVDG